MVAFPRPPGISRDNSGKSIRAASEISSLEQNLRSVREEPGAAPETGFRDTYLARELYLFDSHS